MATHTQEVQVGSIAPTFTVDAHVGQVNLSDYGGKQHVVLYFMREFDCPVCLHHVARLGRIYDTLQAQNTAVLVVGGGDQEQAAQVHDRFKLPFPVLADADRGVYRLYGLEKALNMMQRSGSFLIDIDGVVRYANRSTLPTGALKETPLLRAIDEAQATLVQ